MIITADDTAALTRAIEQERRHGDAKAIDAMLKDQSWHEAGVHASWCCQDRNLRLRPWECPPLATKSTDVNDAADVWGWRLNEIRLLKKMLDRDISRYEPDPIAALEAAREARRA